MDKQLRAIQTHSLDFWFARSSIIVIVSLQFIMVNNLAIGPRWLAPAVELAILAPLSFATAWTQNRVRAAENDEHWKQISKQRRIIRRLAIFLTALVTIINFGSLLKLVNALVSGSVGSSGHNLLLDAINIWGTNVIIFALWFWSIDRGGPAARGLARKETNDFLFPQMTLSLPNRIQTENWSPGFIDYLFLSFTNATAFSPTDTLPLSGRAKLLMMMESGTSLLTITLVAARAVNILS
jgi:hypothetical protein